MTPSVLSSSLSKVGHLMKTDGADRLAAVIMWQHVQICRRKINFGWADVKRPKRYFLASPRVNQDRTTPRVQIKPEVCRAAKRLLSRLLARPRCFSTPSERHSRPIAAWTWLMKGAGPRWWPPALTGLIRCDGGLDGCSGCVTATFGGPRSHQHQSLFSYYLL